jgi:hypothetical protein
MSERPLPVALVVRGIGCVLHRARSRRPGACLRLFRGRARQTGGGKIAQERRGPSNRRERRQAAGAAAEVSHEAVDAGTLYCSGVRYRNGCRPRHRLGVGSSPQCAAPSFRHDTLATLNLPRSADTHMSLFGKSRRGEKFITETGELITVYFETISVVATMLSLRHRTTFLETRKRF